MPPDCKKFVESMDSFLESTNKLIFGLPFHKLWKTKNWKALVNSLDTAYKFCSSQIQEKFKEIEEAEKEPDSEVGMDFLSYMIHSGKMSKEVIAVNAVDLMSAGVDTVSPLKDIES